ncbi:MAG: SDR family oxidoreductase [Alphaproteobacteria bacterium]|jgi:NAD(P)-dependent dehydrogenase (short-subunit alcohol dehydrogenase family)|nr:SDR family oxidoreductase [Alphaproteobacteria bacterium]
MQFDGKVTVVTGGASGIGAASARNFAKRGAKVAVADLNDGDARKVADEIGAMAVACDVGNEAAINDLVARVEAELGPVGIFFNNAGIATGGDPLATDLDVWQRQWDVNMMAHVYATRAVLPGMLERGSGYLIHTASMAGILTSQGNLPYAVTKHAVVGFAEWMSITYHGKGIRTSLLAPLGVRTPMLGDTNSSFARLAAGPIKEPEEVAEMVALAVEEERFLILTDDIAQTWMNFKHGDLERWLKGMRRMQATMEAEAKQ